MDAEEKGECINQEKGTQSSETKPFEYDFKTYVRFGRDPASELSYNCSGTPCLKCSLVFVLFVSLSVACFVLIAAAAYVLDQFSDCAKQQHAGAFLVVLVILSLLYCYWRDAYKSRLISIAERLANVCGRVSGWHFLYGLAALTTLYFMQFSFMLVVLQWSLITLIYGPDISSNMLKWGNSNGTWNSTQWRETTRLSQTFYNECFFDVEFLLLLIAMLVIWLWAEVNSGFPNKTEALPEPQFSKTPNLALRLLRKACGSEMGDVYLHFMVFLYGCGNFTMFPVLSGWITADYVESLTMFTAFFLFTIPTYLIYFIICLFMELLIIVMHRNEADATPSETFSETTHDV